MGYLFYRGLLIYDERLSVHQLIDRPVPKQRIAVLTRQLLKQPVAHDQADRRLPVNDHGTRRIRMVLKIIRNDRNGIL